MARFQCIDCGGEVVVKAVSCSDCSRRRHKRDLPANVLTVVILMLAGIGLGLSLGGVVGL